MHITFYGIMLSPPVIRPDCAMTRWVGRDSPMTILYVEPQQQASEIIPLVRSAVESQIVKLELALKLADKRLQPFEQKYGVVSARFISEMTAEDLVGGDDEYVHWAGEYRLRQRLLQKLDALRGISFRA
jgi:hypothetical protein